VPLLLAGLALAANHDRARRHYLPYANQRQERRSSLIKGAHRRPTPIGSAWIFGEGSKIYNYDLFDPTQNFFGGLTVLEIDPATFQVQRRVFASRARWCGDAKVWVLEGGWVRDFSDGAIVRYERLPARSPRCQSLPNHPVTSTARCGRRSR